MRLPSLLLSCSSWIRMALLMMVVITGVFAAPPGAYANTQPTPLECPEGTRNGTRQLPSGEIIAVCNRNFETDQSLERGARALALFYYSMGRTGAGEMRDDSTCLSCDFIAFFTTAMANFSASIFVFFQAFFVALAPLILAAWIAVRVIKLSMAAGEGAGQFFSDMIRKLALFFFIWGFLFNGFGVMGPVTPGQTGTGGTGNTYYAGPAWHLAAPELLEYSFELNNDIRSRTAAGLMSVGGGDLDDSPFECRGLGARVEGMVNNTALNPSITAVTQTACVVERMHVLGISTGVALLSSAWYQGSYTLEGLLSSNFKTIWGVILLSVYGLSAVWLVFLLLDVVTKALVVAAFLPILGLAAILQPTRQSAQGGLMQLLAVPVVAFALGLTSLLGFYLITGTVNVYNATYVQMSAAYNTTLQPIAATDVVDSFAEFIRRIQIDQAEAESIPTDVKSPWLHYLMFVGLGIFTLGKKIVSILENIMGIQGSTAMADNAKALALKGFGLAAASTMMLAKTGMSAVPVAGAVGAAGLGGIAHGAGVMGKGMMSKTAAQGLDRYGAQVARAGAQSALRRISPFGRR